jgi:hypothetical protein
MLCGTTPGAVPRAAVRPPGPAACARLAHDGARRDHHPGGVRCGSRMVTDGTSRTHVPPVGPPGRRGAAREGVAGGPNCHGASVENAAFVCVGARPCGMCRSCRSPPGARWLGAAEAGHLRSVKRVPTIRGNVLSRDSVNAPLIPVGHAAGAVRRPGGTGVGGRDLGRCRRAGVSCSRLPRKARFHRAGERGERVDRASGGQALDNPEVLVTRGPAVAEPVV